MWVHTGEIVKIHAENSSHSFHRTSCHLWFDPENVICPQPTGCRVNCASHHNWCQQSRFGGVLHADKHQNYGLGEASLEFSMVWNFLDSLTRLFFTAYMHAKMRKITDQESFSGQNAQYCSGLLFKLGNVVSSLFDLEFIIVWLIILSFSRQARWMHNELLYTLVDLSKCLWYWWCGHCYEFWAVPFGLRNAPGYFLEISIKYLHRNGAYWLFWLYWLFLIFGWF